MRSTALPPVPPRAQIAGVPAVLLVIAALAAYATALDAQFGRRLAREPAAAAFGEDRLLHGGRERSYLVHDFSRGRRAPVVIVLHGGGGNAQNAVRMTGFDRVAEREGLLIVYPNGTPGREGGRLLTWNAGHCCAGAMRQEVDDVGFVNAIIERLVATERVDASRVYVTGMSNGAMMAHRLGIELSPKIAAIAPVVGALFGDEPRPRAPVAAFIVVGAADKVVRGSGGPLQLRALLANTSAADHDIAPAVEQARYWARANGCAAPTQSITVAADTTEWRSCTSGAPVVYHVVANNGHAWPGGIAGREGGDRPAEAFDATDAMWAFFKAQRRTR